MRFVVVTVRLENGSTRPGRLSSSDFMIQDGNGVRREYDLGFAFCYQCRTDALPSVELGPGGSISGSVVLTAPAEDTHLGLVYKRPLFDEVLWDLF
jgi:hypothetical protein